MHRLKAITALGGTEPRVDQHGPITLSEKSGFALASVAARAGGTKATMMAIKSLIGAPAPNPGQARGTEISAFWTGPDQWMLEAPYNSHETLFEQATAEVKGKASVTEQSDGWCRFDLQGEGLSIVMERLCAINLHNFDAGHATRTSIEHLGCFVICRTKTHISILGPRSSAGSLHHRLLIAIRSAY